MSDHDRAANQELDERHPSFPLSELVTRNQAWLVDCSDCAHTYRVVHDTASRLALPNQCFPERCRRPHQSATRVVMTMRPHPTTKPIGTIHQPSNSCPCGGCGPKPRRSESSTSFPLGIFQSPAVCG